MALALLLGTCRERLITPVTSPATQLAFTVQPSDAIAGAEIVPAVEITAQDAQGNTATGFTGDVTVTLGTNPSEGTLFGTTTVPAVAGVATFEDLSIDRTGDGYTLTATASELTSAESSPVQISPGAAVELVFTMQPSTIIAGVAITPAVQVTALDAHDNTATGFTGNVTVALGANPGGGTLSGTTTVRAVDGVATFGDLSVNRTGDGYTLTAAASGLTSATSGAVNITAGAAARLVFTRQPSHATAGAAIAPAIQISARDAQDNAATGFTGSVTVALGNNPGGGTLSGTTTVRAVDGVATFGDLSINRSGDGYTLTASASGLTSGTSGALNITAGAAVELVFTMPPSHARAGAAITPAVQISARDEQGNTATEFTGNVTVAIGTNPGGGTLSGFTTVRAVAGVAAFANLSIDRSGTGYTLTATAPGLTTATSAPFDIIGAPAPSLVFIAQPTSTAAGAAISPAVQVTARDGFGNTLTGFTGDVTLTITPGTGTSGATLSGTRTVAAVAGVATFSDLTIDKVGSDYTLAATATGMTGSTSAPFAITAGPATNLVFTVQPSTTRAGAPITPPVQVTVRDAQGNTATGFTGTVTLAIGINPAGGILSGPTTVAAVAGVAKFPSLSINSSGAGYTLTATANGLTEATSAAFDVNAASAASLVFTVQPANTAAGAAIVPNVRVTARDAQGNTVMSFAGVVTVTLTPGTGADGATLSGTTAVTAAAGVATFSNLRIDRVGSGYTLAATATGLMGDTSAPFAITAGPATELVFTVQPRTTSAGAAITPAVQVTARDPFGNSATGFTDNVTVAIGTNPGGGGGGGGGTLSGTTTIAAAAGVATFSNLSIDRSGAGYTLTATAPGLTGATSAAFDITTSPVTQLVFTVQPRNAGAGAAINPAVQVTAQDALGNTLTGFTANVTLTLLPGTGPSEATLSGTTTVAAMAGVATFADLSIDKAGSDYMLAATAAGISGGTSAPFAIIAGPATQLVFTVQPSTTTAGASITPAVRVSARDAQGNTATGFTGAVMVAIGTNPASGILSGTTTVTAVAGVATFSTLSVDKSGTGYTLVARAPGLAEGTSVAFTVSVGAATQLAFTVEPSPATAGATMTPAVQVTAKDALGNTLTGFSANVTLTITPGTGTTGATLSGTTTVAAQAGVATFFNLSINTSGTDYTLSATAPGVSGDTSAAFTITAGPATQLAFTVQPGTTTAGAPITPAVQATARDAHGNTATGFTGTVTLTITPGTGTSGAALSGTTAAAGVGGVATFPTLSINQSGTGYTLSATAPGLARATSTAFDIAPAAVSASQSTVAASPSTIAAGSESSTITVTARDANGNPISGATVVLAATGGGNTLTQPAGPTNASGVATGTFTSTVEETKVVSAIVGATAITQTATVTVSSGSAGAILVGAGDIADCSSSIDEATAALLDGIPGTVFTAGDNAYDNGTAANFANCYEPTWGRHKARTRPSPGNHDYNTSGASAYYAYFGDNAGPAGRGYFSYDLGAWHIISLNSNIDMAAGSAQEQWLRADLAANPKLCTLAYWHHARFSSGTRHGSDATSQPLWQALYDAGADVVIVGHDHTYERFGPQTADGTADAQRGIREFVVGVGGRDLSGFGPPIANSEARNNVAFGVLKLTLRPTRYEWEFVPIAGQSFTDSGSDSCH